jgi:hypothetical protein
MTSIDSVSDIIEKVSPYYKKKGSASEEHKLVYDSSSQTLEPVYFWILDFVNDMFSGNVEKLIDNFTSSPGSGHFGELQQRASIMQQQATKTMGDINTVIKSIINLIYSLKEFEMRLEHYKSANSDDKDEKQSGILALKQIWMDNVDVKRGRGSINMLAHDMNFATLRDAFMTAETLKDIDKMDLNDRVKRILKPRLKEFLEWRKRSEQELKKRFEIERNYLKSQVKSLQLYSRWVKPYLIASEKLKMKETDREPSVVNIFNTLLLELTLFGKKEIKVEEEVLGGGLPSNFKNVKNKRKYYSCVLIDFVFRGIPQRASAQGSTHYVFGGRAEVTFRGYCLNEDELAMLEEEMKKDDIHDALKLIEGTTTGSLDELREDIEKFINEEEKQEQEEKKSNDVNPFSALFGFYKKKKKKEDKDKNEEDEKINKLKEKGIRKDNYVEGMIRDLGESKAKQNCFTVFDVYKKAHGMASHPSPFD